MTARLLPGVGGALVALLLLGCPPAASPDPSPEAAPSAVQVAPGKAAPVASSAPAAPATAAPAASSAAPALASAAPAASSAAPAASAAPRPADPENKIRPPLESEDLTGQARKLFEAIKADNPAMAADFFFPREPFIPLKDVKGAGKYWDQLYRVYESDIHQLHKKRGKELADATFEGFALGSTPTFVKPGEEANKIGYHRTFNGKLRYRVGDQTRTLETKVIISWAGRWYITHLLPFKKH